MNPILLDPGDYVGTYKLIGGEISLDFVNTISWPGTAREHDWLDRPGNFIKWALAINIINQQKVNQLNAHSQSHLIKELDKVHQVRSNLTNVLKPLAFDALPSTAAIEQLNVMAHQICTSRLIDQKSYQWIWNSPMSLTDVLAPVIWNATHILTDVAHTRIGYCPSCEWLFYDTTRNRSRRWCDMEDCGSRHKSLNYYRRKKSVNNS
jgi:predicted RNA-binding Zn ribbon-like protein